jgi:hypothetical protein
VHVALWTYDTVTHVIKEGVCQTLRVALAIAHCFWVAQLDALVSLLQIVIAALKAIVSVISEFFSVAQLIAHAIAHKHQLTERHAAVFCGLSAFRAASTISFVVVV